MHNKKYMEYDLTNDWFTPHKSVWLHLLNQYKPRKTLEIGAYEGACTCFVVDSLKEIQGRQVYCIDTWGGGMEHSHVNMTEVEHRFDSNLAKALSGTKEPVSFVKLKGNSSDEMLKLLANGHEGTFELIYIDGSHQAPDVLGDSLLAFKLAKVGGLIIWDDYLWSHEPLGQQDTFNMPKPAIDAFVNLFQRKIAVLAGLPIYQLYAIKVSN